MRVKIRSTNHSEICDVEPEKCRSRCLTCRDENGLGLLNLMLKLRHHD